MNVIEIIKLKMKFAINKSVIKNANVVYNSKYIHCGKNVRIKRDARLECYNVFAGKEYFPKLIFGNGVIINQRFTVFVTDLLIIGENTIIANDVLITTENHGMNPEIDIPYHAQPLISKPVLIGRNCWIGAKTTILPGAELGDNVIVGCNSVVTKKFPSNVIIAGCPAKILKTYDFDKHTWINYNDSFNEKR